MALVCMYCGTPVADNLKAGLDICPCRARVLENLEKATSGLTSENKVILLNRRYEDSSFQLFLSELLTVFRRALVAEALECPPETDAQRKAWLSWRDVTRL